MVKHLVMIITLLMVIGGSALISDMEANVPAIAATADNTVIIDGTLNDPTGDTQGATFTGEADAAITGEETETLFGISKITEFTEEEAFSTSDAGAVIKHAGMQNENILTTGSNNDLTGVRNILGTSELTETQESYLIDETGVCKVIGFTALTGSHKFKSDENNSSKIGSDLTAMKTFEDIYGSDTAKMTGTTSGDFEEEIISMTQAKDIGNGDADFTDTRNVNITDFKDATVNGIKGDIENLFGQRVTEKLGAYIIEKSGFYTKYPEATIDFSDQADYHNSMTVINGDFGERTGSDKFDGFDNTAANLEKTDTLVNEEITAHSDYKATGADQTGFFHGVNSDTTEYSDCINGELYHC